MNELFSKISWTAVSIVYLFICGTLYLVAFWSTFDIDVTSLIPVSDIPRSFVYPFLFGSGVYAFQLLLDFVHGARSFDKREVQSEAESKKTLISKDRKTQIAFFVAIALLIGVATFFAYSIYLAIESGYLRWYYIYFLLMLYFHFQFRDHSELRKYVSNHSFRSVVSGLIFVVPYLCFMIGK